MLPLFVTNSDPGQGSTNNQNGHSQSGTQPESLRAKTFYSHCKVTSQSPNKTPSKILEHYLVFQDLELIKSQISFKIQGRFQILLNCSSQNFTLTYRGYGTSGTTLECNYDCNTWSWPKTLGLNHIRLQLMQYPLITSNVEGNLDALYLETIKSYERSAFSFNIWRRCKNTKR